MSCHFSILIIPYIVEGLAQVQNIETDLRDTLLVCQSARTKLLNVDEEVVKGTLRICALKRHGDHQTALLETCDRLLDYGHGEEKIQHLLAVGDLIGAVQRFSQQQSWESEFSDVACVRNVDRIPGVCHLYIYT